jgi:23S rRNA (guanosine2251-2'-O)-methyltransferase
LSASAVKASAGAVEHLLLYPADDLPATLADLHAHGVRVVGADGEAPLTARQTDLRGPLALVVGSEGQGLGSAVRRRADAFMRIPMKGAVGSLNAAVAGSILLFEALAQRDSGGTATPPPATDASAETAKAPVASTEDASPPQSEPTPRPKRAARASKVAPASEATQASSTPEHPEEDLLPEDTPPKRKARSRAKPSS